MHIENLSVVQRMVAYIFKVDLYEFKARLVYKMSFRTARATQKYPVSNKTKINAPNKKENPEYASMGDVQILIFQTLQNETIPLAKFHLIEYPLYLSLQVVQSGYTENK